LEQQKIELVQHILNVKTEVMQGSESAHSLVHNVEHLICQGAEVGIERVDWLVARAQDGVGVFDYLEWRFEPEVRSYTP
jgi:hypothetical protein